MQPMTGSNAKRGLRSVTSWDQEGLHQALAAFPRPSGRVNTRVGRCGNGMDLPGENQCYRSASNHDPTP